ncbi:serine/threonine-protein phosphatase with EF-hands 2-like [Biomphalaria glabrata]|uniref:Serine/threonine-protein phosphatase with EF-hands n=1 Tax=Biomphalaria glabrata TaxID=6526 RepID=A0A9W3B347_BIOGL|nr:serine/threonine-protein phosphatase with EF-hands 2-like [Biomphalaria glabrata]XP_055893887.1 serine/threonine-protein phosphatase with EF-hands 2-like [Biomphalaria glabrata]
MGCGTSSRKAAMGKTEKTIKAAILIQRWYRRYKARLEARRKATWCIFQSIEYAGEQDQFKLYNFFNSMVEQFSQDEQQNALLKVFGENQQRSLVATMSPFDLRKEEETLRLADPSKIPVDPRYDGPVLQFPINKTQIKNLITAFKANKVIHEHYLLDLLHHARTYLMKLPNINRVSTLLTKQVTICGDIHGQLNDLFVIIHKNGLPSDDNPYIFNGDFVDRGNNSIEVITLLLTFLLDPSCKVYLNRGNHEDHAMNIRYGFTKEVMRKYKEHAAKVIAMFNEIFCSLPLATIVDQKVLVVHGGISEHVDLRLIETIDRKKYVSILRPPAFEAGLGNPKQAMKMKDLEEWQQIVDILWSDPRAANGMVFNTFRGGGCYFGPDVTQRVLAKHSLQLLIRSHQCKEDGYEYTHGGKVLTVFSASNYYEEESNKGAYVKLMRQKSTDDMPICHVVQYIAQTKPGRRFTITERTSYLESSAVSSVKERIIANRSALTAKFAEFDPAGTGIISSKQWFKAMESVMGIDVPWRILKPKLVSSEGQNVLYETTFQDKRLGYKNEEQIGEPSVTESLYRNKEILETIFRAFDKDNSGHLSMAEFSEACQLLVKHANITLTQNQIRDIATSLDLNKDGMIDFNEFLEAFRIVDTETQEMREKLNSFEIDELKRDKKKSIFSRCFGGRWSNSLY